MWFFLASPWKKVAVRTARAQIDRRVTVIMKAGPNYGLNSWGDSTYLVKAAMCFSLSTVSAIF